MKKCIFEKFIQDTSRFYFQQIKILIRTAINDIGFGYSQNIARFQYYLEYVSKTQEKRRKTKNGENCATTNC